MKILTLFRHGKAAPADAPDHDFQRPLTKGGAKQAKRAAKTVRKLHAPVDLIVSSPATRAMQTSEILAEHICYDHPILWREEIYAASPQSLLSVLKTVPEDSEHVILVGHSPGLKELIAGLCTGSANQLSLHLPSAAIAHVRLEIFWWNQIRWGCGELRFLTHPKLLGK